MSLAAFARRLPKVELHLHLDGSLSEEFIVERARARGIKLPMPNAFPAGAHPLRTWLHEQKTAARDQDPGQAVTEGKNWGVFDFCNQFLQNAEELSGATEDLLLRLATENVRLCELRFCPSLHCDEGLSEDDAVTAVRDGFERGSQLTGIVGGVIICALRSRPEDHGVQMAELAGKHLKPGLIGSVVGYDVAGDEGSYALVRHKQGIQRAQQLGVPVTVHAGEWPAHFGTVDNIRLAVELGVQRIGHGLVLGEHPDLLNDVVRRGVGIECCLTANVGWKCPSYQEHPILSFIRAGAAVSLNSDNRLLSGAADRPATSTGEIEHFISDVGGTLEDVRAMMHSSIGLSFSSVDSSWRKRFMDDVDAVVEEHANALGAA